MKQSVLAWSLAAILLMTAIMRSLDLGHGFFYRKHLTSGMENLFDSKVNIVAGGDLRIRKAASIAFAQR